MLILTRKNMTNNTMYTAQDPHTFLQSFKVILIISLECDFLINIFNTLSD